MFSIGCGKGGKIDVVPEASRQTPEGFLPQKGASFAMQSLGGASLMVHQGHSKDESYHAWATITPLSESVLTSESGYVMRLNAVGPVGRSLR